MQNNLHLIPRTITRAELKQHTLAELEDFLLDGTLYIRVNAHCSNTLAHLNSFGEAMLKLYLHDLIHLDSELTCIHSLEELCYVTQNDTRLAIILSLMGDYREEEDIDSHRLLLIANEVYEEKYVEEAHRITKEQYAHLEADKEADRDAKWDREWEAHWKKLRKAYEAEKAAEQREEQRKKQSEEQDVAQEGKNHE